MTRKGKGNLGRGRGRGSDIIAINDVVNEPYIWPIFGWIRTVSHITC
jgi:hypothetical protein